MVAWDALVLLLAILDAAILPAPQKITVERRFENSPVLGERTEITIEVTQESNQILEMRVTDALIRRSMRCQRRSACWRTRGMRRGS